MVSQGRIGAIINAKPTQRRGLLEEAAGNTGLHARRHEAELRLRAAETNLERLEDVVGALEEQHRLLKRQARQATRYRNLSDHIKRHEAILLHLRWTMAQSERAAAAEQFAQIEHWLPSLPKLSPLRPPLRPRRHPRYPTCGRKKPKPRRPCLWSPAMR